VNRRGRWLNRTVLGVGLASLLSDLSHETVTTLLPAFLASMGAAAAVLGTIEGFADGFSTVAKLYGGWLADRLRRRKPLCVCGYAFMAAAPVVIALAVSWPLVLCGRVLAWISRGARTPARKALMADAVTPDSYGRAFGFERAMDTTGAIVAPLAIYALLGIGVAHRTLILASAFPALLAALAIVFLVRERTDRTPIATPFLRTFGGFDRGFREFLGAVGLFGLGDFADTFFILYAASVLSPEVGATRAAGISVALYAVHNVFYAVWSYLGGFIADRGSRPALLASGYLCAASAVACMLAGVHGVTGLAIVFALAGAGVGIYEAVEDTIAASLLPSPARGSGFGLLAVVTGLGDLLSSLLFGWLWSGFGVRIACVFALVPMLAGTVLVLLLGRSRRWR